MSEYNVVDIGLEDQYCIVKALEELGYKPQIHEKPKNLHGYQGDSRNQKAHIIIPRSQVGSASNDVGFEKKDGKFIAHISEYDKNANTFKMDKLKQLYAKHKVQKFVKANAGKYSLKNTRVEKDGTIKIRLGKIQ